jgi:hypothetical protein
MKSIAESNPDFFRFIEGSENLEIFTWTDLLGQVAPCIVAQTGIPPQTWEKVETLESLVTKGHPSAFLYLYRVKGRK